jgi:hypothetical protein
LPEAHAIIERRARQYCLETYAWLRGRDHLDAAEEPTAVIRWFHFPIATKVHRALHGLAEDDPLDREWPADHDGSAKVALLGIEESHAAWLSLVERGIASDAESAPFIAHLVWLGEALEGVFPKARAFVRPGFDEPEEVSVLLAEDRRP